ncbi:hypothetical protein RB595_008144 [Gaeumannomyces hyphopodioides]
MMSKLTQGFLLLFAVSIPLGVHGQSNSTNSTTHSPGVGGHGAHCVTGATYCGYILLEDQGFDEKTVKEAWNAGKIHPRSDLNNGGQAVAVASNSTDKAWLSTLYVCLPVDAKPKLEGRQIPGVCEDAGPRKLEVLVYCKGEGKIEDVCLNPKGDRIGRCKVAGNV